MSEKRKLLRLIGIVFSVPLVILIATFVIPLRSYYTPSYLPIGYTKMHDESMYVSGSFQSSRYENNEGHSLYLSITPVNIDPCATKSQRENVRDFKEITYPNGTKGCSFMNIGYKDKVTKFTLGIVDNKRIQLLEMTEPFIRDDESEKMFLSIKEVRYSRLQALMSPNILDELEVYDNNLHLVSK